MHRLLKIDDIIDPKWVSHFEIFEKSDIPNFSFHFSFF